MGKGVLNIAIRDKYCVPIRNCWKVDLHIKTCSGVYVQDFDLPANSINDQLIAQFPGATITVNSGMPISIQTGMPMGGNYLNDIRLEVLRGCYKIKARVCFTGNEDTNEIFKIVKCEEVTCADLLLPETMYCGHGFVHPALLEGIAHNPPREQVKEFVRFMALAADTDHIELIAETDKRMLEAQSAGLTDIYNRLVEIKSILDEMNTTQ